MKNLFLAAACIIACSTTGVVAQEVGTGTETGSVAIPPINPEPVGPGGVTIQYPDNQDQTWLPGDVPPGGYIIYGKQTGRVVVNGHVRIICASHPTAICTTLL
jgi:hypothetical protein